MPIAHLGISRLVPDNIRAGVISTSWLTRTIRLKSTSPSTVDRGTRFENGTLQYLTQTFPSMSLIRTGGANDGGVDLLGWWHIEPSSVITKTSTSTNPSSMPSLEINRVRVIVQCKNEQKKLGPIHVRELRGVATNVMQGNYDGLAILAASNGFSKQCLLQGLAWDFPLLFLHLLAPPTSPIEDDGDNLACISILPNDALSKALLQDRMDIKHINSLNGHGERQTIPAVYIDGKRL